MGVNQSKLDSTLDITGIMSGITSFIEKDSMNPRFLLSMSLEEQSRYSQDYVKRCIDKPEVIRAAVFNSIFTSEDVEIHECT